MNGGPKKLTGVWTKAYPALPQDTLIGQFSKTPPFIPSYEHDCTVNLNYLLCYEYYRIWRREIEEHLNKRKTASKPKKLKRPTFEKHTAKTKKKKGGGNKKEKNAQKGKTNYTGNIKEVKEVGEPPAQFESCICDQF